MGETITAIYQKGNLRLLKPLPLPENSEIQIQILSQPPTERQRARAVLAEAGMLAAPVQQENSVLISEEELSTSAKRLAQGGALSELIIAERDEA